MSSYTATDLGHSLVGSCMQPGEWCGVNLIPRATVVGGHSVLIERC
jgi:hypothetical protein